jgi:hypothetical protein
MTEGLHPLFASRESATRLEDPVCGPLNLFANFEQFALADNPSRLTKHLCLFFFSIVFNQVF